MAKYEEGDIVKFYFVIKKDDKNNKIIQGWTDNKNIAKFYLEFHNCKDFTLKTMEGSIEDIYQVTEENLHDEIKLYNINVKDYDKKGNDTVKSICIPATETEFRFVNEETNTFLLSRIRYSYINSAIPYLKNKYQEALNDIFLNDIINKVIYERRSKIVESIEFDQLMVLYRSFSDNFGK